MNTTNQPGLPEGSSLIPGVREIRKNGNKLQGESSLYLQQHAHNPMYWYPWGKEALERAKLEDKPIFLSIGYSSCHWCHVMEEKVFENENIAGFMNENFINIKVDREERPDLDAVYMQAVQMLSGRGGWPMSVFLTPEQKPFYGGTYFPPENFSVLTKRILEAYQSNREAVFDQSYELFNVISGNVNLEGSQVISDSLINEITQKSIQRVDRRWGGLNSEMKFPTPLRWQFLLHQYRKTGNQELAQVIKLTLDNMASGGIYDQLGGGFHRYTVERTWMIPHFEKMLYDNAQMVSLYLEAYAVFKTPRYAETARETLDFMISEMGDPEGGFYSSYDADSGGEEGSFYTWTTDEIKEVAGEKETKLLTLLLGLTESGNFEGSNVLSRRISFEELALKLNIDESEVIRVWSQWRPELLKQRSKRVGPGLDKKIVSSWNGLAISALSKASMLFDDTSYLLAAEKTLDRIIELHGNPDGSLFRTSTNGITSGSGILDDYAFLANACFDLFQAGGKTEYLETGLRLLEYLKKHFRSEEAAYYLTPDHGEAPMGRQVDISDSVEPSGNSSLMLALLKASALIGSPELREEVERVVAVYLHMITNAGMEMAGWLDVANFLNNPFHEVMITGTVSETAYKKLYNIYRDSLPSYSVLINTQLDKSRRRMQELIPSLEEKISLDGYATAYVCQHGSCQKPTSDPDEFKTQLLQGWKI